MKPAEGRKRVVIEAVRPQIDCNRHSVRRFIGDRVTISAAIFADGHDHLAAKLLYRHANDAEWRSAKLTAEGNDLWSAEFSVDRIGNWQFAIEAWVDHFATWCADLKKRLEAQEPPAATDTAKPASATTPSTTAEIPLALKTGAKLLQQALGRARLADATTLNQVARSLEWMADQNAASYEYPISDEICELAGRYPDPTLVTRSEDFTLWVDRERARCSTWYELFPRSAAAEPGRHGTFADVETRLEAIKAMGFDVLYLPPIHPIGVAFRKGPNNSVTASAKDHGSPWAIGSSEGGHTAIHPGLGTFADFDHLVAAATDHGMEIALDIAFQCSPDHPWVTEHPSWFTRRPDGSIQYAENPPKKYQDIYPLNFESTDWRGLWDALLEVFTFWIGHGVTIFRVDNPHTKALPFWEWVIAEVHQKNPEVIFLAEAFTRPHVMYSLAKAGFTQSYTYFTWRTEKPEIEAYFTEITTPPISDFFTPNLWPNTPDILHASLQTGGRAAFMQRLILAATLGASYGIYGPAYELGENEPMKPGSEEYRNSEKYELRQWDLNAAHSIAPLITKVNAIRRENVALQSNESLHFHPVDNPHLICYSKRSTLPREDGTVDDNLILVAVNLDARAEQSGWVELDLRALDIHHDESFDVEDLLTGNHYNWHDRSNFIALRPEVLPAHIFRITRSTQA